MGSEIGHAIGYGLVSAGIMGLAASGLALQAAITNFINFAYGDYLAVGGYFALTAHQLGLNMYVSTILAMAASAVFSWLSYRWLYGPLQRRGVRIVTLLIVSVGMSLALESAIGLIWGPSQQTYSIKPGAPISVGPFLLTGVQIEIILFAIVGLVALDVLLRFTKAGKAMRAMSENMPLAQASGIETEGLTQLVWGITGALSGLAGVMLAISVASFTPSYGFLFLFLIFAAVIIGGIGKLYGTLAGALIVGIGISVAQSFIAPQYADALAFGLLILVLMVKPQGLFGGKLVVQ